MNRNPEHPYAGTEVLSYSFPAPAEAGIGVPPPRRALLHLLLFASTALTLAITGGLFWEGLTPEPPTLAAALTPRFLLSAMAAGLPYALAVLAILGAHEMGHYVACRVYGIPATLPFFLPGIPPLGSFGALIRIRGPIPDRRALFDVAAAGPIAGFVVALPILVYGVATAGTYPIDGAETPRAGVYLGAPALIQLLRFVLHGDLGLTMNALAGAGWVGMLVTSLNLFPVGQLDGGHAVYALSRRLHRFVAFLTLGALAALIVGQYVGDGRLPPYLLWFAILLWMRDRHPRLVDESRSLGPGRIAVALLLLAIFVLAFIPVPLMIVEG